jgi:hypothetical protein
MQQYPMGMGRNGTGGSMMMNAPLGPPPAGRPLPVGHPPMQQQQQVTNPHRISSSSANHAVMGGLAWGLKVPLTMYSDENVANRKGRVWHGATETGVNDGQMPNFRGVRIALGTGYAPVEANRRAP